MAEGTLVHVVGGEEGELVGLQRLHRDVGYVMEMAEHIHSSVFRRISPQLVVPVHI